MSNKSSRWQVRFPMAVGFSAVFLMLGGLGAWSVGTEIAGSVVARGTVELQSERQVIQHPDGGVVAQILARDGDTVAVGDVLLRLDGTYLRSELAVVESQLIEIFAQSARHTAARDAADAPDFSDRPRLETVDSDTFDELTQGQHNLFMARRSSFTQELRQLDGQRIEIGRQIDGMQAQLSALHRQRDLILGEVDDAQSLFDRGLMSGSRLVDLKREDARLEGEIGKLTAMVAEAETRISSRTIDSLRVSDKRREEAITGLGELGFSRIGLQERRQSLKEQIARLDVRAPVSGIVFASRVVAVQSVVRAAEPMMFIMPGDQPFQVSTRIDPIDIDQVFPGQEVSLMFTTFNRRTTPEIPGTVLRMSADAKTDEATGTTYYDAIIIPDAATLATLPDLVLLPGMPVETFLKTAQRTPLSYLTQPLTVYFHRAFREGI